MSLVRPLEITSPVNAIAPVTCLHASISLDVDILYLDDLATKRRVILLRAKEQRSFSKIITKCGKTRALNLETDPRSDNSRLTRNLQEHEKLLINRSLLSKLDRVR